MKKLLLVSAVIVFAAGCSMPISSLNKNKVICPEQIVYARNENSKECLRFVSPCYVPKGWLECSEDDYGILPKKETKLSEFLDEEAGSDDQDQSQEESKETSEEEKQTEGSQEESSEQSEEEQKPEETQEEDDKNESDEESTQNNEKNDDNEDDENDLAIEDIKIFYIDQSQTGCDNVVGVNKEIIERYDYNELNSIVTILNTAVADGYGSEIPAGTRLKDLRINGDGSATIKFNDAFKQDDDCKKEQSKAQIKQTLLQFSDISSVDIVIVDEEGEESSY